jgi:tRNA G46 methylase TrmB
MSYETIKLLKKIVKSKNSIFMTTDSESYIKDTERLLNKYKASFGSYKTCILSENNKLYGISRYQRKAIEKEGKIYLLTL